MTEDPEKVILMSMEILESDLIKPLLIVCKPEDNSKLFFEDIFAVPGISQWEIAISKSAQETGIVSSFAGKCRFFLEYESPELIERLNLFGLIAVYPLSLNSLAKFALGIRDSFPSTLFGKAIELSIPVLMDISVMNKFASQPPHLEKVYRHHWSTVLSGLVSGFSPDDFADSVKKLIRSKRAMLRTTPADARKVITRDDVLEAHNSLTNIIINRGTIVTDLAREEAASLGVKILSEYEFQK
ncbi:MAG: hypothetical protein HQM10_07780 [Candidatus Riflebacteria bacterium]|nr:hypothetical protein [Candidatus Riflebacteria bacterium]